VIFLRSTIFNLAFYVWTFLIGLLFPLLLLAPGRWALNIQRIWSRGIIGLAWYLAGIRYEIRGLENVPDGPVLLASKHQSVWDTMIFQTIFYEPTYVLKKELLKIPLFGAYCLKMGMIPVDREGGGAALKQMMLVADSRIREGRSIIIFPEGTRMPIGKTGPYHPGVGGLYKHLGVPLVPVALNSGLYWPRKGLLRYPGTIVVEFLPAILPGVDRRQAISHLQENIEKKTEELCREVPKRLEASYIPPAPPPSCCG
jgi:1-acyl-sn-glycerol-3-phosphate acyltransferase